jgi:HK97 family phage major capsid protein
MPVTPESLQAETLRVCRGEQSRENAHLYKARYAELDERTHEVTSRARREGHAVTEADRQDQLALLEEHDRIGNMTVPSRHSLDHPEGNDISAPVQNIGTRFLTKDGREVHALSVHEKLSDLPQPDGRVFTPLSLGKAIVGLTTGNWSNARAERLTMAEGSNATGGNIVPEAFSLRVIDLARANSALMNAGAITIPWSSPSDEMVLARVAKDPTFALVAENATIPPSDVNFDQVRFSAKKIAALVVLSRELAEDAPNVASLIETTLAKALGAELDRMGLVGEGGAELNGLLNWSGVDSTDSIGAIAWADIHAAVVAVKASNHQPTGYITSPTIGGDLDLIQASTAGTWLGPPPSLARVPRYESTNCPDENLFVGDFSQFVFAMRTTMNLEVSATAGDMFQKHQVGVKLTLRCDVNALHRGAFHNLLGITT